MLESQILAVQQAYPRIYHACHVRHIRAASTPFRLSARDAALLAHLSPTRSMAARDLAAHLGIGPPTLSEAVAKLARLGYVEKRLGRNDRRTVGLVLTPLGVEATRAASVLDTERLRTVLQRLTPEGRRRAVAGLGLLARAAAEANLERRR